MTKIGTVYPFTVTMLDVKGERHTIRLYGRPITSGTIDTVLSGLTNLRNRIDNLSTAKAGQITWGAQTVYSKTPATDARAYHEKRLLVHCRGVTTGAFFSFILPSPDYGYLRFADPPNGNAVLFSGPGAHSNTTLLVQAIANSLSTPDNPNEPIAVVGMELVD